jgi:hypothetical protein
MSACSMSARSARHRVGADAPPPPPRMSRRGDDELRGGVDRIALSNGLLNRFLFAVVKRSRMLPHGGNVDQDRLGRIAERLTEAVRAARLVGAVGMTAAAAEMWEAIYPELTTDHPGLFGSLVARAEAHTVRLALLYALADQSAAIEQAHLESALAIWKYSVASGRVLLAAWSAIRWLMRW